MAICVTALLFAIMVVTVGTAGIYLFTYTPDGPNIPNDTVLSYDENDNPVIFTPHGEKSYNFLILGHDRAATLTDVIMLVNFNVTDGEITVMQIPRDTYVGYGVATSKINATYATYLGEAKSNGEKDPEIFALRRFADVIERALCTKISYTAIMNLDGFANIVDIIGGVEMNVPFPMKYTDPDQGLIIDIEAGYQTLDGKTAEQIVRFRSGYVNGDMDRQDVQKLFIGAFVKKVKSSVSVSKLTGMADLLLDNLHTDITVGDFMYFGRSLIGVDPSRITMLTAPSSPVGSHVVLSEPLMVKAVNEYFAVYENDITTSVFDRDKIFVNLNDREYTDWYNSETALYGGIEYKADRVDGNAK